MILPKPAVSPGKASRPERPPDPEAEIDDPEAGGEPQPEGRAGELRRVDPGPAAGDTAAAISAGPRRTIGGRPAVVAMGAILDPLPYVAGRVVEAERIGLERSGRRGLAIVPAAAASVAIGVALADRVAPGIGGRGAGARRIFPFGLGEQTVAPAGRVGQPRHKPPCV